MSDMQQGPGWWQASDGKWYPPESQPSASPPQWPAGSPPPTGMPLPSAPVGGPAPRRKKPLWKRWWFLVAVGVVVIGVIAAIASPNDDDKSSTATTDRRAERTTVADDHETDPATAPDDGTEGDTDAPGESTEAAETTEAATEAPAEVVPLPPNANPALAVVGVDTLPAGEPGKLSVIAQASELSSSGSLPIVVRNMTDKPVARIQVTGTARDASGTLVGSGSDQGFTPFVVGPGEIAFGYVYFGFDGVPEGTTFELSVSGSKPGDVFLGGVDLVVAEQNRTGDSIVVALRNDTDKEISGPISLDLMCFDEAGVPTGTGFGFTDQDTAAPGATVTGTISIILARGCDRYILGGSGYDF